MDVLTTALQGLCTFFKKIYIFLVKPHVFSFETFSQRQGSEESTQLKTLRELKNLFIPPEKFCSGEVLLLKDLQMLIDIFSFQKSEISLQYSGISH